MKKSSSGFTALFLSFALTAGSLGTVNVCAEEAAAPAPAEMISSDYREVEMKHRPYARWWLAEGSHTDETLREAIKDIYEAGYGGVEFVTLTSESEILDDATYGWGSEEWIHDSKLIVEECQKYGMSVSMTGGTYWATANLPSTVITPDDQSASQELGYVTIELKSSDGEAVSYSGELPQCILPGDATVQNLVSVLAAPVLTWGNAEDGSKTVLDTDQTQVVTDLVQENDGVCSIDFTAENAGDYILFAFYQYGTSESYGASVSGQNYTINYYDKAGADAFIDYWNTTVLTEDLQEVIDQIDECGMYMDSLELCVKGENTTRNLWCTDMLEQFRERRGYDLEKYLPILISDTPDTLDSLGVKLNYVYEMSDSLEISVDNLRTDFYQTATELYEENCLQVISDWLHTKNMKLRAEPSYGKALEMTQTVNAIDYLETESFEFGNELDAYRMFAGAAHLYNKRLSSETGADIFANYSYNNGYYRQMDYLQYAAGIQKTVVHGYSCAYGPEENVFWPGYEGMSDLISERFNERQPGFADYAEVNANLSRIQKVLEQGKANVDILMLRSDYLVNNGLFLGDVSGNRTHNNEGYYWKNMGLQNAGYTYEYVSPLVLNDCGFEIQDGTLTTDGVRYQALVVMEDELPLESANTILAAAEAGLPVLFVNNVTEDINCNDIDFAADVEKVNTQAASTTGRNDGNDEELARVVEQIKALDNVAVVESQEEVLGVLEEMGISANASYDEPNAEILTVMRETDDARYLYVYNYMYTGDTNYAGKIMVDGEYEAYILDTWTGEAKADQTSEVNNGKTELNVDLAPGEVKIYVLSASVTEEEQEKETTASELELTGWNLVVDSFTPGERLERTETNDDTGVTTTEVSFDTVHTEIEAGVLDELVSWKDIDAIGEDVSGIGTYTTTFIIPEEWETGDDAILHAGSFNYGTASVEVNGQKVPVNMDTATADLSAYVEAGENTIVIRVSSSLNNVARTVPTVWWLSNAEEDDFYVDAADYGMTGDPVIELHM